MNVSPLLLLLFLLPSLLAAELGLGGYECDVLTDLMIVDQVNCRLNDRIPVYFNHLLYGGYWSMPSSRMGSEGEIGAGWSEVPPYRNFNLRFQLFRHIELSGNYRVFRGVDDPALSKHGFGDFSDKGANIKCAFWFPEDTNYVIPGFAVGWEDFIGTKAFEARYAVLTQVFPQWNMEASVGYGDKRIGGWFGGISWIPFRASCNPYIKDIALVAEYDAIRYRSKKREPHPKGRSVNSPINFGLKYRLWNHIDFSASCIRGKKCAFSLSSFFPFGTSQGMMPKLQDPLPYRSPINTQPIGPLRPCDALAQDLYFAFGCQGFKVQELWLSRGRCGDQILRVQMENPIWRFEGDLRERLNNLLAYLVPSDVDQVVVEVVADGLPIQEYHYRMEFVRLFGEQKVCPYELKVLSPISEVACGSGACLLYKEWRPRFCYELFPKTYSAFGSAKGKFKYLLGVQLGINGYLWNDWQYSVLLGYPITSDLYDVSDVDKLNPSQLINVRTDSVNYYKQKGLTVDEAYIEKSWNIGCGNYLRGALGLFEEAYGGAACEWLYYPVDSCWAFGIEGAYLRKRTYGGVGFTDVVRKLEHGVPVYIKPFYPSQYFMNFYYNIEALDLDVSFKGGKFLANDWGVRTEGSRYFPNGMRFYAWVTYTNGKDQVNGHRYYDKGVGISIPLDLFLPCSSRKQWGYGMSAWLRDVGAIALTGSPLYHKIRDQREQGISNRAMNPL
jgi:hypothetical protein